MFTGCKKPATPFALSFISFSANEDFKVDQRIIDIARDEKTVSEDVMSRPKSSSFMSRPGSFTTKITKDKGGSVRKQESEENEKEGNKDEKLFQQFNKNVSHFLAAYL